MAGAAWDEIDGERYEDYWGPFDARFRFRTGMTPDCWQAIDEPTPSVTFDLSQIYDGTQAEAAASVDALNSLAQLAMVRRTRTVRAALGAGLAAPQLLVLADAVTLATGQEVRLLSIKW